MRMGNRFGTGLLLLGLGLGGGGCFLDEIDKAGSWAQKEEPAQEPVQAPQASPQGAMTNWWATAKSLGSEESKSDIVGCDVGNSLQFREREYCLARGGEPQ